MQGQKYNNHIIYINDTPGYSIKAVSIILCLFLFLFSIGILGFGIWLAVWTNYFNYINVILNYDIYRAGYILFIISGTLLLLVSFIGLCGASQENSGLLLAFVIVTIICEVMLITVATMGLVFNVNFQNTAAANLTYAIQRIYGVNLQIPKNQDVTTAIDVLQSQLRCCGSTGLSNSTTSWELYRSSTWFFIQNTNNGQPYVPTSCCVVDSTQSIINATICQGIVPYGNPAAPPLLSSSVTVNPYLYTQGCISIISSNVNYFSMVMFGLALAAALYLLIIIILSCCLLRRVEVSKKDLNASTVNLVKSPARKIDPKGREKIHNNIK